MITLSVLRAPVGCMNMIAVNLHWWVCSSLYYGFVRWCVGWDHGVWLQPRMCGFKGCLKYVATSVKVWEKKTTYFALCSHIHAVNLTKSWIVQLEREEGWRATFLRLCCRNILIPTGFSFWWLSMGDSVCRESIFTCSHLPTTMICWLREHFIEDILVFLINICVNTKRGNK